MAYDRLTAEAYHGVVLCEINILPKSEVLWFTVRYSSAGAAGAMLILL